MKYRIYILFILAALLFDVNKVSAFEKAMCYYQNENVSAKIEIQTVPKEGTMSVGTETKGTVNVLKYEGKARNKRGSVSNFGTGYYTHRGFRFERIDIDSNSLKNGTTPCPKYAIVSNVGNNVVFVDYENVAKNGVSAFLNGAQYAPSVSADEFWSLVYCDWKSGDCEIGQLVDVDCEKNTLFGDVDYAGGECTVSLVNGECPLGKETPPSVAYLINMVLSYVRIIVPILIILLGSFDLARAVIASKEDEMRKAQLTFFKRLIAGICVFLAPIFINVVISLANIAWEGTGYEICKPEIIYNK